jgi:hypothetical protein
MKKPVFYLCLIAVSLVFMGCPYESEYPLDVPSIPVQKDFMGKWFSQGGEAGHLSIKKKDDHTYLVQDLGTSTKEERKQQEKEAKLVAKQNGEKYEKPDKAQPVIYEAHTTIVNGASFVNVLKADSRTYYLYKVEGTKDRLSIMGITPYIKEKFTSSRQLHKFVADNMQYSFFFNESQTFTRTK